jgi:sugar (pentulose or hexulose) kinase
MKKQAILVFDIGKTNKKYFLFDEIYSELEHEQVKFSETIDDEGFLCDDLSAISNWIIDVVSRLRSDDRYDITHINFSGYGATLVNLDKDGEPCTPMYNYQKEFPEAARERFEEKFGSFEQWSKETSSPYLGMLNAGLQLFWLKYEKPFFFEQIRRSVFLPQYLSYLLTGIPSMEFTGIGCHTGMWNFEKNDFHDWIFAEGLEVLFPPLVPTFSKHRLAGSETQIGIGIHDSSAALVPYKRSDSEPFMLVSTGTWSICLNPFNYAPLTAKELKADCLCYLQPEGNPVKASRFFMGHYFGRFQKSIADHFGKPPGYYHSMGFDERALEKARRMRKTVFIGPGDGSSFTNNKNLKTDLERFATYEEAYHKLMDELVDIQVEKINLVSGQDSIRKLYIDGGFSSNTIYIKLLERKLSGYNITPSDLSQGSALGAAMVVFQELGDVD